MNSLFYFIMQTYNMDVKDCNGNILTAGDSVIVTKDLSGK